MLKHVIFSTVSFPSLLEKPNLLLHQERVLVLPVGIRLIISATLVIHNLYFTYL